MKINWKNVIRGSLVGMLLLSGVVYAQDSDTLLQEYSHLLQTRVGVGSDTLSQKIRKHLSVSGNERTDDDTSVPSLYLAPKNTAIGPIISSLFGAPYPVNFKLFGTAILTNATVEQNTYADKLLVGPVNTLWTDDTSELQVEGTIRIEELADATAPAQERVCTNDLGVLRRCSGTPELCTTETTYITEPATLSGSAGSCSGTHTTTGTSDWVKVGPGAEFNAHYVARESDIGSRQSPDAAYGYEGWGSNKTIDYYPTGPSNGRTQADDAFEWEFDLEYRHDSAGQFITSYIGGPSYDTGGARYDVRASEFAASLAERDNTHVNADFHLQCATFKVMGSADDPENAHWYYHLGLGSDTGLHGCDYEEGGTYWQYLQPAYFYDPQVTSCSGYDQTTCGSTSGCTWNTTDTYTCAEGDYVNTRLYDVDGENVYFSDLVDVEQNASVQAIPRPSYIDGVYQEAPSLWDSNLRYFYGDAEDPADPGEYTAYWLMYNTNNGAWGRIDKVSDTFLRQEHICQNVPMQTNSCTGAVEQTTAPDSHYVLKLHDNYCGSIGSESLQVYTGAGTGSQRARQRPYALCEYHEYGSDYEYVTNDQCENHFGITLPSSTSCTISNGWAGANADVDGFIGYFAHADTTLSVYDENDRILGKAYFSDDYYNHGNPPASGYDYDTGYYRFGYASMDMMNEVYFYDQAGNIEDTVTTKVQTMVRDYTPPGHSAGVYWRPADAVKNIRFASQDFDGTPAYLELEYSHLDGEEPVIEVDGTPNEYDISNASNYLPPTRSSLITTVSGTDQLSPEHDVYWNFASTIGGEDLFDPVGEYDTLNWVWTSDSLGTYYKAQL